MSRIIGFALIVAGAVWVGLLLWMAANEGEQPKPFLDWPAKAYALLAAGAAAVVGGAYLCRPRARATVQV